MNAGLEMLFRTGHTLNTTLPVITKMRKLAPATQRLWTNFTLQRSGRDLALKWMWEYEDLVRDAMLKEKLALDSAVLPSDCQ
jgi:hypothetical protein